PNAGAPPEGTHSASSGRKGGTQGVRVGPPAALAGCAFGGAAPCAPTAPPPCGVGAPSFFPMPSCGTLGGMRAHQDTAAGVQRVASIRVEFTTKTSLAQ